MKWIISLIEYSICILCMALFASAAYEKVIDHETFKAGLSKIFFIKDAAGYIALLVPLVEILVVALMVLPGTQRLGLYFFVAIMIVFTGYIVGMKLWAENLPCHCNLIIENLSWGGHIWFNLLFIAMAVFALWLGRAKEYKIK